MNLKPIPSTIILCVVIFLSTMLGYVSTAGKNSPETARNEFYIPKAQMPIDLSVLSEKEGPQTKSSDFTESYVLRDNEGTLALYIKYENGDEHIYNTYDVSVKLLPQKDREELKKGIEVSSLSSALELLENYIS